MSRFIIISILVIEVMLGLGLRPAFGITQCEKEHLFKETEIVCAIFNKPCTVKEVEATHLGARTSAYGNITVTSKLLEVMNEREIRGVLYHEAGHRILEHVEKTSEHLMICKHNNSCNMKYISAMKREYEFQADRFATYLVKTLGIPEGLADALRIITPQEDFNKTHSTHPSTADRIKQIDTIMGR